GHVVHLEFQDVQPLDRLDRRLGPDFGHGHRPIQPCGRRGRLLLHSVGANFPEPGYCLLDRQSVGLYSDHAALHRDRGVVAYCGLATTQKLQYLLVAFQVLVLVAFAVAALMHSTGFNPTTVSVDWFDPAEIGDFSPFVAGASLSIFMFWGWDVVLTMKEETKNPS